MANPDRNFVAYNNSDDRKWRPYVAKKEGESDFHWTRRRYREETLKGSKLWVIEGHTQSGSKRYELKCVGEIFAIAPTEEPPWRHVKFVVTAGPAGIKKNDLTAFPWFKGFLKKAGNFGFGIVPITDRQMITDLEALSGIR